MINPLMARAGKKTSHDFVHVHIPPLFPLERVFWSPIVFSVISVFRKDKPIRMHVLCI